MPSSTVLQPTFGIRQNSLNLTLSHSQKGGKDTRSFKGRRRGRKGEVIPVVNHAPMQQH